MSAGEADLWAAVIQQALGDACGDGIAIPSAKTFEEAMQPDYKNKHRRLSGIAGEVVRGMREAVEAWRFLTAQTGAWRESRELICGHCGLDPEILRNAALKRGPSPRLAKWLALEEASIARRRAGDPPSTVEMVQSFLGVAHAPNMQRRTA